MKPNVCFFTKLHFSQGTELVERLNYYTFYIHSHEHSITVVLLCTTLMKQLDGNTLNQLKYFEVMMSHFTKILGGRQNVGHTHAHTYTHIFLYRGFCSSGFKFSLGLCRMINPLSFPQLVGGLSRQPSVSMTTAAAVGFFFSHPCREGCASVLTV